MENIVKIANKWPIVSKVLSALRRFFGGGLIKIFQNAGITLVSLHSRMPGAVALVRQVRKESNMLLNDIDACYIYALVKKTEKIQGDIAEIGVYRGGSAKIICEITKKPVHLFDTFEGLPTLSEHDDMEYVHKGELSASLESVKSYLKNYQNIYFYKGLFPATAEPIKNKIFSFVHLDVDIYESTLNCLKFFYPRMSRGGVMISHDYPYSKGVKQAFDEFFADKPEIVVELFGASQCLIVKL